MGHKKNEDSRHFAEMWKHVLKAKEAALSECDDLFRNSCALCARPEEKVRHAVEEEYRRLREELKEECYSDKAENSLLDGRKMGAIMCKALIREKVFCFEEMQALELAQKKKEEYGDSLEKKAEFNKWIVNNLFINYKVAYLFSVGLVVETTKERLLAEEPALGKKLNGLGWMVKYPQEKEMDSFNVSMVLGLGKADLKKKDFDMFLYAMQLYQMEQYSLLWLKYHQ